MFTHRLSPFRWIAPLLLAVVSPAVLASVVGVVDAPATSASVLMRPPSHVTELQTVSVTGVQPGPGLWKVSKRGHVLWVLGTLDVLPKGMRWKAREVQAAIANSQQVLEPPQLKFVAKLGSIETLSMLPSLIGVGNNPDGKHLADEVPADQYTHWRVLKFRYLRYDLGVEMQRPIFAAYALIVAAIKDAELSNDMIDPLIKTAARQHALTPTPIAYTVTVDQPQAVVNDFKKGQLLGGDCFARTLDFLASDVVKMRARANAWATGDLDALRRLPLSDRLQVCVAAVNQTRLAQKLGLTDSESRIESTWVAAAGKALAANRVTFAELPMDNLLGLHSYLTALEAQGSTITPPDGLTEGASGTLAGSPAVVIATAMDAIR